MKMNLQDFRRACHILIWGFVITGGIGLAAVPKEFQALLFLSLLITIMGLGLLIRVSRNMPLT
jgi:hypothetical protein